MTAGALILVFWAVMVLLGGMCGVAFIAGMKGAT